MDRYDPGIRKLIGAALAAFSIAAFAQTLEERLFEAIEQSKPLVAEGIVSRDGVSLDARNDDGESVLQWAVMAGNPAVAHELLERFEKE